VAFNTYSEFLQRVRHHRPSELLPVLAANALQFFEQDQWLADGVRFPWALAAAAKASIIAGNEYRTPGVSDRDVLEICAAYNQLETPLTGHSGDLSEGVGAFLVRTEYEQFSYQESLFEEISRAEALFGTLGELKTEVLDSHLIDRVLGCSLREFIAAGFVLAVGARQNAGFFNPDWSPLWEGPKPIDSLFSMEKVRHVFQTHFLTTFDAVRTLAGRHEQPDLRLRHYEFNPLVGRPFVKLPDGRHVAPQPHFVYQRLSPSALYYSGVDALSTTEADAFTRDVGVAFQDYIGRQLRLMPGATVLPEIVYDASQRSVDWFVIFDQVVVLVEAKSTRLSHLARMGGDQLAADIDRCCGRAVRQISRTDELLTERHPAFSEVPTDRPRIAIIATMEPYWGVNNPFLSKLLPHSAVRTMVASASEVEYLVGVVTKLGGPESLIGVFADEDRRTWNLGNALPQVEIPRNPILKAAWDSYPFPTGEEGEAG
jgi:hypothetical protein